MSNYTNFKCLYCDKWMDSDVDRERGQLGLESCQDCAKRGLGQGKIRVCGSGAMSEFMRVEDPVPEKAKKAKKKRPPRKMYAVEARVNPPDTHREFNDLQEAIEYRAELLQSYTVVKVTYLIGKVRGSLVPPRFFN